MDARKLVWGVVLLLAGLGLAGWSVWHGVPDARHWWHAHRALQQLAAAGGADARGSGSGGDLLGMLRAGVAAIPGARQWLQAGLQRSERAALHALLLQLALLLLAGVLLWLGNRLLGQASARRGAH